MVRYAYKFLIRRWLRSNSYFRLRITIHSLSKPRRGWGAGVQRRLFWLDQRQRNHTLQYVPCKWQQQEAALPPPAASTECSTGSFKAGENRDGCADRELPAHQLISLDDELSWKSVLLLLLLLLLHKYRILITDHIIFTLVLPISFQKPMDLCVLGRCS